MQTQKLLEALGWSGLDTKHIHRKYYPERGLSILNYDQCQSPLYDPVVKECRSLILDQNFRVVSRAFDRFYNWGESKQNIDIDWTKAVVYEKVDGSLVKLFYDFVAERWEFSTRGSAFAEGTVNRHSKITFREYILYAADINEEQLQTLNINPQYTYIFEVIGRENQVVTRYDQSQLVLLGVRSNLEPYEELKVPDLIKVCVDLQNRCDWNVRLPLTYEFGDMAAVQTGASKLKNLQEGFVVYDGKHRVKVKNALYVRVHHLRHKPLDKKRILELIFSGELDEYLQYFPQDQEVTKPYSDQYSALQIEMRELYAKVQSLSAKELAQSVSSFPYAWALFQARKKGLEDPWQIFTAGRVELQMKSFS